MVHRVDIYLKFNDELPTSQDILVENTPFLSRWVDQGLHHSISEYLRSILICKKGRKPHRFPVYSSNETL